MNLVLRDACLRSMACFMELEGRTGTFERHGETAGGGGCVVNEGDIGRDWGEEDGAWLRVSRVVLLCRLGFRGYLQ